MLAIQITCMKQFFDRTVIYGYESVGCYTTTNIAHLNVDCAFRAWLRKRRGKASGTVHRSSKEARYTRCLNSPYTHLNTNLFAYSLHH